MINSSQRPVGAIFIVSAALAAFAVMGCTGSVADPSGGPVGTPGGPTMNPGPGPGMVMGPGMMPAGGAQPTSSTRCPGESGNRASAARPGGSIMASVCSCKRTHASPARSPNSWPGRAGVIVFMRLL